MADKEPEVLKVRALSMCFDANLVRHRPGAVFVLKPRKGKFGNPPVEKVLSAQAQFSKKYMEIVENDVPVGKSPEPKESDGRNKSGKGSSKEVI